MEQDRASPVQFHHPKLAWQAAAEPSNCGQLDRQHNDDNGLDRSRSPGHPALRNRTQSKRRTNGQTQVNTSRIPWRMELLPCASADVKLVQVIYARALSEQMRAKPQAVRRAHQPNSFAPTHRNALLTGRVRARQSLNPWNTTKNTGTKNVDSTVAAIMPPKTVAAPRAAGLTDAELLEQFIASGDAAALEVLVW